MKTLSLLSPAKINLFLHVFPKRKDGYHNLHTLFERVSLCDRVTLRERASGISVRSNLRALPRGEKNISCRAAQLLQKACKVRCGVDIRIEKNIPMQAGLGGGSSNAAAVLLGLNRLWRLGLSRKELCRLGAQLGSDVPFFVLETPFAEARGRGDILKKIPVKSRFWHVILKPSFGISTKEAYAAFDARRRKLTPPKADVKMLLRSIEKGYSERLSELLTNSLEVTGNKQLTKIYGLKKRLLESGALASLMSGSGSCVFGLFRSKGEAAQAAKTFKRKGLKVFVASTF